MKTKNNLKILFITRAWGNKAGGMERLSFEMITAISKQAGITTQVVRPNITAGNSLFIIRIRSAIFAILVIPRALLAARQADVIHLGDSLLSAAGYLIQKIYKKPVICQVHGLDILYPHKIYQLYLNIFFRNFTAYFANSSHVKRLIEKKNISGQVLLLNPGMSDNYFDSSLSKKNLADLLNIQIENKYILFTSGRLVKRKGHAWFIKKVMPFLPSEYVYVIAGNGSEKENIKREIDANNLTGRVILLGRVSDSDLKTLYNTVDIFVQPNMKITGDLEGFGLVLLEAALCNKLVLAHNIEGMTDAIHHNQNGIQIPYQDTQIWIKTLTDYAQNKDKFTYLSNNARPYTLKNFAWENIVYKYIKAFNTVKF